MKSRFTKLSLALVSTVFLLGCQEQGPGAVGPEARGPEFAKPGACPDHPSCKDDGGGGAGGVQANLTMSSGMTALSQLVGFKDGENTLEFIGEITLKMNLINTHNAKGDGINSCVPFSGKKANPTDDELVALFDKLEDDSRLRSQFFVHVDMNDLGVGEVSEESTIHVVWEDNGSFNLSVGKLSPNEPGGSTVTVERAPLGDVTVTFTGGEIRLRNWTGKNPEYFNLTCDLKDDITMVLHAVGS